VLTLLREISTGLFNFFILLNGWICVHGVLGEDGSKTVGFRTNFKSTQIHSSNFMDSAMYQSYNSSYTVQNVQHIQYFYNMTFFPVIWSFSVYDKGGGQTYRSSPNFWVALPLLPRPPVLTPLPSTCCKCFYFDADLTVHTHE